MLFARQLYFAYILTVDINLEATMGQIGKAC